LLGISLSGPVAQSTNIKAFQRFQRLQRKSLFLPPLFEAAVAEIGTVLSDCLDQKLFRAFSGLYVLCVPCFSLRILSL